MDELKYNADHYRDKTAQKAIKIDYIKDDSPDEISLFGLRMKESDT